MIPCFSSSFSSAVMVSRTESGRHQSFCCTGLTSVSIYTLCTKPLACPISKVIVVSGGLGHSESMAQSTVGSTNFPPLISMLRSSHKSSPIRGVPDFTMLKNPVAVLCWYVTVALRHPNTFRFCLEYVNSLGVGGLNLLVLKFFR